MAERIAVHYCIMQNSKYKFLSLSAESAGSLFGLLLLWSSCLQTAGDMFDVVGAKYLL